MGKSHPIEILLRREKKKKKKIKISWKLKDAKNLEEACKTLRKVNWNKIGESKNCRELKVSGFRWNGNDALTNSIGRD